jgi:hypothetical protein
MPILEIACCISLGEGCISKRKDEIANGKANLQSLKHNHPFMDEGKRLSQRKQFTKLLFSFGFFPSIT